MRPPVCVKCRIEMKPEKNGVKWVTMADFGPYQIWDSDKWKCRKCGIEILSGFGQRPLNEHFENGFNDALTYYKENDEVVMEVLK